MDFRGCNQKLVMSRRMQWQLKNDALSRMLPNSSQWMENSVSDHIYTGFFSLKGTPFSITPDPEFLFLSGTHRSVIEKIQYGIQTRMGFMLLTGEVGTGKTTLCRALLDHLHEQIRTVYIINPSLSGQELLANILDDLGIEYPSGATKKELIDRLNGFLLNTETVKPVVIIVDDAQTMPLATLEDLRLLSNLETDKAKLLQMLLVGQPELLENLAQPQMRQLKQRVAVSCHLDYLTSDEVAGYIERRLFIAGNQGQIRFAPKTIRKIHNYSGGVPRMINKICEMALIAAYASNSFVVEVTHLKAANSELIEMHDLSGFRGFFERFLKRREWVYATAFVVLIGAMVTGFFAHDYFEGSFTSKAESKAPEITVLESEDQHAVQSPPSQETQAALTKNETRAYILQLGSFNTLATTLRAVDIYAQRNIETHWSEVQMGDKGLWYRVFAGRFASIKAAREYQDKMNLADAQVVYAPWVVVLDLSGTGEPVSAVKDRLRNHGVDSFAVHGKDGKMQLCTGAFVSQGRAEEMARLIREQTGILTRVTGFHLAGISNGSGVESADGGDRS